MARPATAQKLRLAEVLDLAAAVPLADAFASRRGRRLTVDAGGVRQAGASCVQVLLSAAATWRADEVAMQLVDPSPDFLETLRLFGIAPAALSVEGI
jgi:chemotaxis protein CheX